jgi:hypothetical protein
MKEQFDSCLYFWSPIDFRLGTTPIFRVFRSGSTISTLEISSIEAGDKNLTLPLHVFDNGQHTVQIQGATGIIQITVDGVYTATYPYTVAWGYVTPANAYIFTDSGCSGSTSVYIDDVQILGGVYNSGQR